MSKRRAVRVGLMLTLAGCLWSHAVHAESADKPKIHTVLPPDAIAAILKPEFVPASAAKVEDVTGMIGVVFNNEAHAYSATLLNSHEIVNDTVGGIKVATTW